MMRSMIAVAVSSTILALALHLVASVPIGHHWGPSPLQRLCQVALVAASIPLIVLHSGHGLGYRVLALANASILLAVSAYLGAGDMLIESGAGDVLGRILLALAYLPLLRWHARPTTDLPVRGARRLVDESLDGS